MQGIFEIFLRGFAAFDFIADSNFCVIVVISFRFVFGIADAVSLLKIIAISQKASPILSPTSTLGMLFLLGFFRMLAVSLMFYLIASASVKTGMGVVFGRSSRVSASISFIVLGL